MSRLTDKDKKFGPLTFGRTSWRPIRVMLSTGGDGDDDAPSNSITAYALGWAARLSLPTIIQPHRIKRMAESWDAATVERMGRNWYYETFAREYGFCCHEGHLSLHYGQQTHSSRDTKSRGWFLPWTQWRHVRYSLYDGSGALFWERRQKKDIRGIGKFADQYEAQEACPSASFVACDYDGQEVIAKTFIQEREWHFGEGSFRWLSWFRKPMIRRSLDIDFNKETGPEKGSWKGGTCGTSIDMLPGELHEAAFRRYCEQEHRAKYSKYKVKFAGVATGG